MRRTYHMTGHTIGMTDADQAILPSGNHFKQASLPTKVAAVIREKKLKRVAGNIYECPSTKDFWSVQDGKIMRLTVTEVDNGESLAAAPRRNPGNFLTQVLNDLTF
jgi:hypothetical protein